MNARDLSQSENLRRQIGDVPIPGLYLLDVSTTQFVVVELVLLKALIREGNPGLFISVDRPYRYMVHLLDMHGIPHHELNFLDAQSRFSSGNGTASPRVGFFEGPSHIDELPKALREYSSSEKGLDLSKLQFALIDNVSILLLYNSHQAVEVFLKDLMEVLSQGMAIFLVIDQSRNPNLYHAALSLGAKELKLESHEGHPPEQRVQRTIGGF